MQTFRVIGGDPAEEFIRIADGELLEEVAVLVAREYLAKSRAGTIAAVLPSNRLFANNDGRVVEIGGAL